MILSWPTFKFKHSKIVTYMALSKKMVLPLFMSHHPMSEGNLMEKYFALFILSKLLTFIKNKVVGIKLMFVVKSDLFIKIKFDFKLN